MLTLSAITTNVNLVALAVSLGLGLYVVTRSRTSRTAWLAAGALWALAAYFFQSALALNLPDNPFGWMRALIVFIVPFWVHITFLLLPPSHRPNWLRWVGIPLGYLLAVVISGLGIFTNLLFATPSDNGLYTNTRMTGPAYYLILPLLALGFGVSLWNLWRARQTNPNPQLRGQFDLLLAATALEALAGALVSYGTAYSAPIPFLLPDLFYFIGIFIFGFAVARYNATLEGRPIDRDFLYTLLVVGSLTLFYCLVVWVLYLAGQVSFLSLALTVVGTVLANSLFDRLRLTLDRVFYQRQFQRLRSNLRGLAREVGTGQTLAERLNAILSSLVRALRIKRAFIAIRDDAQFNVLVSHETHAFEQTFSYQNLAASEIIGLVLPARKNLPDMKLLIPLFAHDEQIGALVLGERENGSAYSEADLELLEDLGDQIARVIDGAQHQQVNATQLNTLVEEFRARERALQLQVDQMLAERAAPTPHLPSEWDEEKLMPLVEDALRKLHDYPYLGEHALAKLRGVDFHLAKHGEATPPTFLDRGKAVNELLIALLDELKPDAPAPKSDQIVPREWQLYTILYNSYVLEEPNREVMAKLYIGEGTFNRARRRALRAVAKSLAELEASVAM